MDIPAQPQTLTFTTALPQIIAERLVTHEALEEVALKLDQAAGREANYSYDRATESLIRTTYHSGYGNTVDTHRHTDMKLGTWAVWKSTNPEDVRYVATAGTTEEFTANMIPGGLLALDVELSGA